MVKEREERENDWGQDKTKREKRIKNRKNFRKELPAKDFPNRIEQRQRPRRNDIQWYGNDYDYKEEFGDE
jgi:hypothetical protein